MTTIHPFDIAKYLTNEAQIDEFLAEAASTGDASDLIHAIETANRARAMLNLSKCEAFSGESMKYPVVLHSDDGVKYGVTVPDLAGCFSAGETIEDALTSVLEAIDLHLEGIIAAGGKVPAPSTIAQHQQNTEFAGGVWGIVDLDTSRFWF